MGQDDATVRAAYDTVADDYSRLLPDTTAESAQDLAVVDHFAELVAGAGEVLDAGCGAGRMSRYLADRGCTVQGVDLSPRMVAAARRAHPDLEFSVASLADLPFEDARFAGTLVWYSTIHVPDTHLPAVLAEVVRVVRPGGHLLVGFQTGGGTVDLAESYGRHGHEVVLERYRRTIDEMAALLAAARTVEVAGVDRPAEGTETDGQAMLLARVVG